MIGLDVLVRDSGQLVSKGVGHDAVVGVDDGE